LHLNYIGSGMGGNCSSACGDNCCKKNDSSAQASSLEYAPERGATEENAEQDFVKEVAAAKLAARNEVRDQPPGASDVPAGLQDIIEGLGGNATEETDAPSPAQPNSSPTSPNGEGGGSPHLTIPHEEGHASPRPEYDEAQLEAVRLLKEACRTNPQSVVRIENAIATAKEAGISGDDLKAAERHLERIKVIVGMHRAADAGDAQRVKTLMQEAKQLGGVPEREVERAMETLNKVQMARHEAERQKQEEEAQKRTALQQKQLATTTLRRAIQEKNKEKLEIALEQAREHDVDFTSLQEGEQALQQLQKGTKGFACCGGGGAKVKK